MLGIAPESVWPPQAEPFTVNQGNVKYGFFFLLAALHVSGLFVYIEIGVG